METDDRLRSLVKVIVASRRDGEMIMVPITLCVGGLLVHGCVITEEEFFAKHGGVIEAFGRALDRGEQDALVRSGATGVDLGEALADAVHVEATAIFSNGVNVLADGGAVPWRGLMERVDGFFFGPPRWG